VIHAAGFVDDGLLVNLDRERFTTVLATKADGAIYLDEATRALALDFFVCFSSAIGVLGAPGQGNYAAANACLDGVATRRRAQGHPALSIAWGPWARVGMAAARRDRGQRLAVRGLASLAPEEGIEALERLLATSATQVLVMRLDPGRWSRAYASGARSLLRQAHDAPSAAPRSHGMLAQLRAAAPVERRALLETHLREQVGQVLRLAAARVDPVTPLKSLGLNSLMSLELRNRLETAFGLTLPATLAWNYPTVTAVAAHLEERLGLAAPVVDSADSVTAAEPELESLLAEIQGLSDEEVRRLLAGGRTSAHE
jgi:acyl carrier protein